MLGSDVIGILTERVQNASNAYDAGNYSAMAENIGAAVAVGTMALLAAEASASISYPIQGLSIVFNSLSNNPGKAAEFFRALAGC